VPKALTLRWQLPNPRTAPAGVDLIGIGADLAPDTLLAAYRSGIFPMDVTLEDGSTVLGWWSPDPRGVIPVDGLHISRSLRSSSRRFTTTWDQDFAGVLAGCANADRPSGWITPAFIEAYTALHHLGWAHSVEVWNDAGEIVGGLYGIQIGGFFAGESMFHRERDASKVALVALVEHLAASPGRKLLDVQWATEHLRSLGAVEISRADYLDQLAAVID
jgi:leucyl/phenylalanyl-tRNA--protein transferase